MTRGVASVVRPRSTATLFACLLVFVSGCSGLPLAPDLRETSRAQALTGPTDLAASDRVVVLLRVGATAQAVVQDHGGTLEAEIPELGLYRLQVPLTETMVQFTQSLRHDARVTAVESDEVVMSAESRQASVAFSEGTSSWGEVPDQTALIRVGTSTAQTSADGRGVLVAILDTGISLGHPALMDQLSLPGIEPGVTGGTGNERSQRVDSNHDGIIDGALGHGTHVAGIVLAVAPKARLLPVRVLDSDGVGTSFDVARGIVMAVQRGAQVVNMSLGMSRPSTAVATAVRYARDAGAVVVAPTGNGNMGTVEFPASMPEVVAVAGTDAQDHRASFSNYGPGTDLSAPATSILSTYIGGGFARWSGTSMAAPFVSGSAALVYSLMLPRATGTPAIVEQCLLLGARSLNAVEPAYAGVMGAGRIDAAGSMTAIHRGGSANDGEQLRMPESHRGFGAKR